MGADPWDLTPGKRGEKEASGRPEVPAASTGEVPTTLDKVLDHAQADFAAAYAKGLKRLRLDILVPGLNEQVESAYPFDAKMLFESTIRLTEAIAPLNTTVLMDSSGTAAMWQNTAKQRYEGITHVKFAALSSQRSTRDSVSAYDDGDGAHADVYLVVNPRSVRGDQVLPAIEKAMSRAPEATWVLLNPMLEDTVDSSTFGIRETDRRRYVMSAFEHVYSYRGLYKIARPSLIPSERGALVKRWGEGWKVFRLSGGSYSLMREFADKPSRTQLSSLAW